MVPLSLVRNMFARTALDDRESDGTSPATSQMSIQLENVDFCGDIFVQETKNSEQLCFAECLFEL